MLPKSTIILIVNALQKNAGNSTKWNNWQVQGSETWVYNLELSVLRNQKMQLKLVQYRAIAI